MKIKAKKKITIDKIDINKGDEGVVVALQIKETAGGGRDETYLANFPQGTMLPCPKDFFELL